MTGVDDDGTCLQADTLSAGASDSTYLSAAEGGHPVQTCTASQQASSNWQGQDVQCSQGGVVQLFTK